MAENGQPGSGFGVLLRLLRQMAGLSREQLAAASGIAARTIQDLERGVTRYPHKDTAELLAKGLGLGGPARQAFAAAADRNTSPAQVLAAAQQLAPGALADSGLGGPQAELIQAVLGSPYRGLAAFTEQDAGFFFGRDQAAAQVLDKMAAHARAGRLLMISGVSGAGKSSLLRAGVLPRLAAGGLAQLPGSRHWPCLLVTPSRTPLHQLAAPAAELAGTRLEPVLAGLRTAPGRFAGLARRAACAAPAPPGGEAGAQRRLVVVADQFEQLFTQCADEAERQAFITALHTAATPGPGAGPAALVVVCVRADFEARCADYPQLAEAVQDRYLLTAMTGRQLRLAITEPARKASAQVADDLTEVLLAEMQTRRGAVIGAGMLPLLSHALDQAWRQRTRTGLTLADYERTGGLERAVAASAQRVYDQLSPARQQIAGRCSPSSPPPAPRAPTPPPASAEPT
jgi:transcriptional regulator with XRE-family HTH domain